MAISPRPFERPSNPRVTHRGLRDRRPNGGRRLPGDLSVVIARCICSVRNVGQLLMVLHVTSRARWSALKRGRGYEMVIVFTSGSNGVRAATSAYS